jgi:dihydroorotate dehydrogenase electron transfer subunit
MGIAPLGFFAHEALKNKKKVHIFIGAKTKELVLCEDGLKLLGAEVTVATEDGSYGEKGLITDLLHSQLTTYNLQLTTIYSCGPKGMLKEVASIAKQNKIGCQISMEAYMACGIGACKGCPIETVNGYKMVCKDGPIFNAEEIKW